MASQVGEVTEAELDGWFKRVYGKYQDVVPINSVLQTDIKFSESDAIGETFNEPIGLQLEHGVTYAATSDGAFPLDPPIPAVKKNAQVQGVQTLLRSAMDYQSMFRASRSQRAFGKATGQQFIDMKDSIHKRVEISCWHGQSGLGTVASVASNVITITTATWAPLIWSGMEGALLEAFDSALTTQRVGTMKITSVDPDARTVTVNAAAASLAATDVLFFKTARTTSAHKDMAGVHAILTNSGTIFGISASTYNLWKATSLSAGSGPLTLGIYLRLTAKMVGKGLDSPVTAYVNPVGWANLATDQAALRRYGAERTRYETGTEGLRFYSQNGSIEIKPSGYVKEGSSYVLAPKEWKRIGATDVTFDMKDVQGPTSRFFRQLSDNAGFEWRCYSHQAIYSPKIGRSGIVTNIVNS